MTNREKLAAYKLEIVPLSQEDGGGYQAFYPQLARTTVGYGDNALEALEDLNSGLESLLESLAETGDELAMPTKNPDWAEHSGRVTLRISKSLHYRMNRLAEDEGISLNSLINDMLQSGATALEAGLPFGARNTATASNKDVTNQLSAMRFEMDRMALSFSSQPASMFTNELNDPVRWVQDSSYVFEKVFV